MPWKVEPAGEGKYYVVNQETGKRMSRRPLSKGRADAQLRALYANVPEAREKEFVDKFGITFKRVGRRRDMSKADRARGIKKYGNVLFADPVNHKYPIDTPGHIRAAWSYIHMPKNAAFYYRTGGLITVQNAIRRAYEREFGHPPGAKNIRNRRRTKLKGAETEKAKRESVLVRIRHGKRDRRGNIQGLTKHLVHLHGGDPGLFRKVVNSPEIAGYPEDIRKMIAARVHKIATGMWPGEHRGKNPYGPEKKKETSQNYASVRNILEGSIHQGFTVTADQLFQRGYIDRDTRIALSGLIGDVLEEFGERFEKTGLDKSITPEDASAIASKKEVSATPTGVSGHGPGGVFSTPGLGTAIPAPKRKRKKKKAPKDEEEEVTVTTKELKDEILQALKGSASSGNYGHAGRPGITGGSAPRFGSGAAMSWITGRYTEQNRQFNRLASRASHLSDMSPQEVRDFANEAEKAFFGIDTKTRQAHKAMVAIQQGIGKYRDDTKNGVIALMEHPDTLADHPLKVLENLNQKLNDKMTDLPWAGGKKPRNLQRLDEPVEKKPVYDTSNFTGRSADLEPDTTPTRSKYPAGYKLLSENVSENTDYKPAKVRKISSGGYSVTLNSGAYAVAASRSEAIKKAQATQYRRDVAVYLHNSMVPKVEVLIDAGYGEDWNRVKNSGYYPKEVIPVVSRMLKKYRRAAKKEVTALRENRSRIYREQRREYSRLKEGDRDAIDRLRELRLEGREIQKSLRRSSRVNVRDYLADEDLE